jgi:hypothetical protein
MGAETEGCSATKAAAPSPSNVKKTIFTRCKMASSLRLRQRFHLSYRCRRWRRMTWIALPSEGVCVPVPMTNSLKTRSLRAKNVGSATNLSLPHQPSPLDGCPRFAQAYLGRKRRAKPQRLLLSSSRRAGMMDPSESSRNKSFSAQVRLGEPGAPVQG